MTDQNRSEKDVLGELTDDQRTLLRRVLEIERSKLHITAHDPSDELVNTVREIIP